MKNNKLLVGCVVVLAAALIVETTYLLQMRREITTSAPFYPQLARRAKNPGSVAMKIWNDWPITFDDKSMIPEAWEPFKEMEKIQRQMNRMFRDSFEKASRDTNAVLPESKGFFEPETDVRETPGAYVIQMDIPGLNKDEITITMQDNVVTITGERKREASEQEKGGVVRQEREFGYFSRSIPLPQDTRRDGIKASYSKGVLSMTLPRVAETAEQGKEALKIKVD